MVVRSGSADAQNLVELSQSYQVIRGDSQETKLKKKKKKRQNSARQTSVASGRLRRTTLRLEASPIIMMLSKIFPSTLAGRRKEKQKWRRAKTD